MFFFYRVLLTRWKAKRERRWHDGGDCVRLPRRRYLLALSFTSLGRPTGSTCLYLMAKAVTGFLTGFDWVRIGFTGFYWVLLGFTGFSLAFMGSTCLYLMAQAVTGFLPGLTGFESVLLGFTGFPLAFMGLSGLEWVSLDFYQVVVGSSEFYCVFLGSTGFYWVLIGFTGFYWV